MSQLAQSNLLLTGRRSLFAKGTRRFLRAQGRGSFFALRGADVEVGQVPVPLVQVEAVADEELVRDRETDVADGEVVHEPAVGAVEQRGDRERRRVAQPQRTAEVVHGQS